MSWCVNTALTGWLLSAPVPPARLPTLGTAFPGRIQLRSDSPGLGRMHGWDLVTYRKCARCDGTLQDFQQLKWKKSLIMCNCNFAKLIARPDFHGDRKGCFPAKFQVVFPRSKATGYARKRICQISPAFFFYFLNYFLKLTIFLEHLNPLRCCHSKMHLRWFKFGKHLGNRV